MWHSAVTVDRLAGLLLGGHVGHQVADTVAVGKFVVVPVNAARQKWSQYASLGINEDFKLTRVEGVP